MNSTVSLILTLLLVSTTFQALSIPAEVHHPGYAAAIAKMRVLMKKVQTKDSTISPQKKEIDGLLEYFDIFTENCPLLVDSSILVALLDKIDRKDAPLSKLRSFDVDMVTRLATNLKLSESYVGMVKMDFNSAKKILITSSNDTKE